MSKHKLKKNYSLGSITVLAGSTIETADNNKVQRLADEGFIAKPRKEAQPQEAEEK